MPFSGQGCERPMDVTILNLSLYLTATFAAALVTGVAGFAFGLVAAAIWLHILTPMQTATLIIAFGLEIAARAAMESALAVPARRGIWSPLGSRDSRMGPT